MFNSISATEIAFVAIGTICLYVVILGIVYGKKLVTSWGRNIGHPIVQTSANAQPAGKAWPKSELLPPLIDKPADHPVEQAGTFEPVEQENDDYDFEMSQEAGATTLLKEAERVVEQIQDVVSHIASFPANPDEVFSKIRAVVSEYRIFIDTEYFDAINSFIAVTVQRDCDLALTEEDLKTLWFAQAA